MADIRDSLRKVLGDWYEYNGITGVTIPTTARTIDQIIALFESEGWVNTDRLAKDTGVRLRVDSDSRPRYLSGAEWLSRFEKEIDAEDWPNLPFTNKKVLTYAEVIKVARRASGVK